MGRKKVGRHYPPAVIKYREAHPQINITVPAAIKARIRGLVDEQNQNKMDLGVYDDRKKETISKWVRTAITNIFNPDFQKSFLTEVIAIETEKEAREEGRSYYKEKKRAADELHEKVVEYRDDLIAEGFKRGRQEGLEKGEVRGRERAEQEFEGRLREAEEGREDTEEAIRESREEGRKEQYEKDKKKYSRILDEGAEEYNRLLKKQKDNFNALLEKAKEECREKFEVRKTEPEAQFKDGLPHPSNTIY